MRFQVAGESQGFRCSGGTGVSVAAAAAAAAVVRLSIWVSMGRVENHGVPGGGVDQEVRGQSGPERG